MEKYESTLLLLFALLHTTIPVTHGFDYDTSSITEDSPPAETTLNVLTPELEQAPREDYYTAGVFEIKQTDDPWFSAEELIKKNLDKYSLAAEIAGENKVDMMVYPEQGLFPRMNGDKTWSLSYAEDVPDPRREFANPCDQPEKFQNSPILRNLSCLAKENNFYLVADLLDVKNCEVSYICDEYNIDYCRTDPKNCSEDGKFIFNTLVVFDREGLLIVRYHKRNLYFEPGETAPRDLRNIYFETEFGNFTVDVCFDLFFSEVVKGAEGSDVTGLAFPTWWFDHTPLVYFATPFQQAWAITNKINLLAANVHHPRIGSVGSGIYSAVKGALVYTHNPDGRSKVLISKVPVSAEYVPQNRSSFDSKFYYISDDESVSELQEEEPRYFRSECGNNVLGRANKDITDYRCYQTQVRQYSFVKLNETEGNFEVCSNGFCCSLRYTAESMDETFYFGVSGKPLNFYGNMFGTQSCFLARCEPVKGKVCRNYVLKSSTIFLNVEIEGSFDTKYVYPFAVNSEVRLTDRDDWRFEKKSRIIYQNLLRKPLLFLCLYGRLYEKDQ